MTQVSTKLRVTTLAVLFAFCSMVMATTSAIAAPTPAPPPPAKGQHSASVFVNAKSTAGDLVNGVFTITGFSQVNGQLTANGVFTGTATSAMGTVTTLDSALSSAVVAGVDPSCQILNLTLGPLNLNLLGLVITIPNPVVLNITAVPGAGNLLGNLLCDVANLLNGVNLGSLGTLLDTLIGDLNNIIAAL